MTHIQLSPTLSLPVREYASQGNAILGIRDSGKTYSATWLAEQLSLAKIPFIAFDPIGVWRFLKVNGKGKGFPIVVAGGESPDLTLTATNAVEIVRAAMRENVSLVIDLFDIRLSKADWRRIVEESIRCLMFENKGCGLRHVFLEEAAEFVPQMIRPDEARVYGEIERLARMGGNSSLGYTLINQRAEQINKAVLELCDCLFLHRQKGKNSLTSLGKWLDFTDRDQSTKIIKSLPELTQGQCWVWPAGSSVPVLVKMPHKRSLHPDRRNPDVAKTAKAQTTDVTKFVTLMTEALPKLAEEQAANDIPALHKRIKELEKQVNAKSAPAKIPLETADALRKEGFDKAKRESVPTLKCIALNVDKAIALLQTASTMAKDGLEAPIIVVRDDVHTFDRKVLEQGSEVMKRMDKFDHSASNPKSFQGFGELIGPPNKVKRMGMSGTHLPTGNKAVLTVCAQYIHNYGATREQISILTGYKRSSRDTYIARLKEAGLVYNVDDKVCANQAGLDALGPDFEPLPTGEELQVYWLEKLPEGERRILDLLITRYPKPYPRDHLDELTGYKRSSRDTYIFRLKARLLVDTSTPGMVKASDILFS